MDIQSIALAIVSSGVVGLLVGYLLNRRFERMKVALQEATRRQAELFDEQKRALLEISETAYRLRNQLREAAGPFPEMAGPALERIKEAQFAFRESLYSTRALLPQLLFQLAHELKTPSAEVAMGLEAMARYQAEGREYPSRELERIKASLVQIEALFESFVSLTREYIGVGDGAPNPAAEPGGSAAG